MGVVEMLTSTEFDVPCPGCGYPIWIRLVEVAAQCSVLCPLCRKRVTLVDDRGSVAAVTREIERAMADLKRTLKGISR